ncbi:MAG: glycosyltransferase family 2 protein [Oscillospiraceae bacterium]|jgi:glycosyltransferase involved in cell wall biosynthesis
MISVVVPLFNEEAVIGESCRRLRETMEQCGEEYEIILVNDGSRDRTPELAKEICRADPNFRLISFSRNFGHQTAITAGMDKAGGDAVIVIDADLQDPPQVMLQMLEKWREGWQVVYGRRIKRKGETLFKKITAKLFYRFLRSMSEMDMPVDAGDFRLLDRKVLDALKTLPEHNRYVRGLVSWLGFRQTWVDYIREERFAGETKYPLKKMLRLASDGITAFSSKPLRVSVWLGCLFGLIGLIYLAATAVSAICRSPMPGWHVVLASLLLLSGVNLIMLGVVGSYISRIYDEVKGRPLYIIAETVGFRDNN